MTPPKKKNEENSNDKVEDNKTVAEDTKTETKKSPNKKNSKSNSKGNARKSSRGKKGPKVDDRLRMLVDASKHEETRVAVAQSGRLEDFEVESLVRRQIKGNIYLAKVTRVEPSLQAAFVNYGGNRHGFLPFSEIHPDYYRIPVADRERLMEEQAELERKAAEEAARIAEEEDRKAAEEEAKESETSETETSEDEDNIVEIDDEEQVLEAGADAESDDSDDTDDDTEETAETDTEEESDNGDDASDAETAEDDDGNKTNRRRGGRGRYRRRGRHGRKYSESRNNADRVSDDSDDDYLVEPFWKRIRRAYKIQEVIKRGQIVLIQVGKEERGNKGAAVTTYITMPGRYCVLMPNTPQSGGVSRKISNFKDRKRMRDILKDLSVPEGMSVILRTAGTSRTKAEIKRDMDYLMRLWNNARDLTLKSTAPALINEEGSLIKRAIRDIYHKDIEEVIVSGTVGFKAAKDMMKMLMPSHAKKVIEHKDATPLFIIEKLEQQIEEMHSPQVELPSGGYLVINPTEALVSIDVNSGRATKERNIDDTALQTNLEAAAEIARQLRLRDLGGLVVIDFIDMDHRRYNGKVEKAMRNALAGDRARIQIGRISSFGLMEMSRQRLHPSLTEAHFEPCPHCHGMGIVKTVDTMALTILRAIEESALAQRDSDITVTMASNVALYLFNHHRRAVTDLEARYGLNIQVSTEKVDSERGFDIESNKRKIENQGDDSEDLGDESDNNKEKNKGENDEQKRENSIEETNREGSKTSSKNSRPGRGLSRRKRSGEGAGEKASTTTTESSNDTTEKAKTSASNRVKAESDNSVEEEKPKKRRGRKPSVKKKIEIEEVGEDAPEKKSDSEDVIEVPTEPTNDNGAESDQVTEENTAAREAETVNEKPKSKKKGWWNKITN